MLKLVGNMVALDGEDKITYGHLSGMALDCLAVIRGGVGTGGAAWGSFYGLLLEMSHLCVCAPTNGVCLCMRSHQPNPNPS